MRILLGSLPMMLASLGAGACVVDHHSDPDPAPAVQPRTCIADITLDGSTGAATPTIAGPFALDRNGVTICLHLDATQNQIAAHFAAATDAQTGGASPFATVLQDAAFVPLQDSWDVNAGDRVFANLEWNAPLQAVTDAMLWVRLTDRAVATQATSVAVSLFEPLE